MNIIDAINSTLLFHQAWLITARYLNPSAPMGIKEHFVTLFDHRIDSSTMLNITTELYRSSILSSLEQSQRPKNEEVASEEAYFRINTDGLPDEDDIGCGHNPGLWTCRVYDVTIITDAARKTYLQCRFPHVLANEQHVREIEYWDEITLLLNTIAEA